MSPRNAFTPQLPPLQAFPPTTPRAAPVATPVAATNPMQLAMQALVRKKLDGLDPSHPLAPIAKAFVTGETPPADSEQRMMLALQQATASANIGDKANVALETSASLAGDVVKLRAQVEQLTSTVNAQRAELMALTAGLPEKMVEAMRPVLEALPAQVGAAVDKAIEGQLGS